MVSGLVGISRDHQRTYRTCVYIYIYTGAIYICIYIGIVVVYVYAGRYMGCIECKGLG